VKLNANIDIFTIKTEVLMGAQIIDSVFRAHSLDMLVTSCYRPGTGQMLHGLGYAVDIRLPSRSGGKPEDDSNLLAECFDALGGMKPFGQFDLLHEVGVAGGDHYHLEFDPAQHPEIKSHMT
jgi:hypothetical protein